MTRAAIRCLIAALFVSELTHESCVPTVIFGVLYLTDYFVLYAQRTLPFCMFWSLVPIIWRRSGDTLSVNT